MAADIKTFDVAISGTSPILMHNARLSDPLDPAAKALKPLQQKKQKTEEEHVECGRVEWEGGLYFDESGVGPYIPGDNLHRMICDAAKRYKLGKALKEAFFVDTPVNRLEYEVLGALGKPGPRDIASMWAAKLYLRQSIAVNTNRVVRVRPCFNHWSLAFKVSILSHSKVEPRHVKQALLDAGAFIGLGDWRPKYGRFVLDSFTEAKS